MKNWLPRDKPSRTAHWQAATDSQKRNGNTITGTLRTQQGELSIVAKKSIYNPGYFHPQPARLVEDENFWKLEMQWLDITL